jgi:hypothetical protein
MNVPCSHIERHSPVERKSEKNLYGACNQRIKSITVDKEGRNMKQVMLTFTIFKSNESRQVIFIKDL